MSTHVPFQGARNDNHLVVVEDKDHETAGLTLLQFALWQKRSFHYSEVKKCLEHYGATYHANRSFRVNQQELIKLALPT